VFLLAGRPDHLVTYTSERDALHDTLHRVVMQTERNPKAERRVKNYTTHEVHGPLSGVALEAETDLLVIDTVHSAAHLRDELAAWAGLVRRRIVIRGTQAFGEVAEGSDEPGLRVAMREWMREHPEWSVIYHTRDQYGLTVISRDPADKPKLPGVITLAANFAKAMANYVADGLTNVSAEEYEARTQICTLCEQRTNDRCSACGCFLSKKAAMRAMECPLGKWPTPGEPHGESPRVPGEPGGVSPRVLSPPDDPDQTIRAA